MGRNFQLFRIIRKNWATPFWGYSLLWKGRLVNIDFELKSEGEVELPELKQILVKKTEESRMYSEEEFLPLVMNCKDYPDLYKVFY